MQKAKPRLVFMGTSKFASLILNSLWENGYAVAAVYTQDKTDNVFDIAQKNNIPAKNPPKFDEQASKDLQKFGPDILIVASYGKILPKKILEIPKFGALNVHPSLLPKFRGPSPLQNAILAGETETGTTILLMDEKVDAGGILAQVKIPIGAKTTYPEMLEKSAKISANLLTKTIPLWIGKEIQPKAQDESRATYCQLIERSDGKVNWSDSAKEIYDRWRALFPWPGIYAFTEIKGRRIRLKLNAVDYDQSLECGEKKIGEVSKIKDNVCVMAGKGAIILKAVQLEGKSETEINSFLNGHKKFLGTILK